MLQVGIGLGVAVASLLVEQLGFEQVTHLDIIQPAQEHAEQIVGNVVRKLGYTPVFRSRPVYSERDILNFINTD